MLSRVVQRTQRMKQTLVTHSKRCLAILLIAVIILLNIYSVYDWRHFVAIGLYGGKTEISQVNLVSVHQDNEGKQSQSSEEPLSKPLTRSMRRERLPTSSRSRDDKRLKEILLWTSFYKDPYYGLSQYGQSGFIKHKCRINKCTTTNDRQRLQRADAVVVHARNPDMKPLPKRQNEKQIFVFFLHEAPPACFFSDTYTIPDEDRTSFNLTITYRYDSDIVRPGVGKFLKKDFPTNIPNVSLRSRSRSVVWVASHCRTSGKREMYIKALAKYIDVDIYGKCGTLNCTEGGGPCPDDFDKRYKFLISAENAVCTDYVSEKVSTALNRDIVPIVYGGLDYKTRLPANSFINIMDFASPRELAKYLKQVMDDEWLYREFFTWKAVYRRVDVPIASAMCELCEKLHDPEYHKQYPDIVKWWADNSCNNSFINKLIAQGLV